MKMKGGGEEDSSENNSDKCNSFRLKAKGGVNDVREKKE